MPEFIWPTSLSITNIFQNQLQKKPEKMKMQTLFTSKVYAGIYISYHVAKKRFLLSMFYFPYEELFFVHGNTDKYYILLLSAFVLQYQKHTC